MARGGVPEWLIGAVCKIAALKGFAGSNPAPSTIEIITGAHVAQVVERVLGKDKVAGSSPAVGSNFF